MRKHRITKEIVKFFAGYLLYGLIGGIGLAGGIDAFSYDLFRDDFNLQFFFLDIMRFLIAFGIVYGMPELIKKKKAIADE